MQCTLRVPGRSAASATCPQGRQRATNIEEGIRRDLGELAELEAGTDVVRLRMQEEIDKILTPELREQIKSIEAQYQSAIKATQFEIGEIRQRIKAGVLALGRTVRGQGRMALWVKPRVTWNSKGLEGYMVAHPEVRSFRKEGRPSVTIRNA